MKENKFVSNFIRLIFLCILFFAFRNVFAGIEDNPPVPISDIFNDAVELIKNWKGASVFVILSGVLTIIIEVGKQTFLQPFWDKAGKTVKKIVITCLGQILGIILGLSKGLKWYEALIAGLITSGGAVAIFNAFKGDQDPAKLLK